MQSYAFATSFFDVLFIINIQSNASRANTAEQESATVGEKETHSQPVSELASNAASPFIPAKKPKDVAISSLPTNLDIQAFAMPSLHAAKSP